MGVLLLVMGLALVAVALVLLGAALRSDAEASGVNRSLAVLQAMTESPVELRQDLDEPFGDRVLEPLRERAVGVGRRLSGANAPERIRRRLDLAGNPAGWTVDRIVSAKVISAAGGLLLGFAVGLMLGLGPLPVLLTMAAGLALGFFVPDIYLYQRAYDRSERIQRDLPDAIDLLAISVEAGLGFDAAVQQVARNTEGPLAEEFSRLLREIQLGQGRSAALRAMGERSTVVDLRTFTGAMVQADSFGVPIGQVLRTQSSEMRIKRRQRAEKKAQEVPVKITVPLIFFILPTLFVAVMGPAVITIMDSL